MFGLGIACCSIYRRLSAFFGTGLRARTSSVGTFDRILLKNSRAIMSQRWSGCWGPAGAAWIHRPAAAPAPISALMSQLSAVDSSNGRQRRPGLLLNCIWNTVATGWTVQMGSRGGRAGRGWAGTIISPTYAVPSRLRVSCASERAFLATSRAGHPGRQPAQVRRGRGLLAAFQQRQHRPPDRFGQRRPSVDEALQIGRKVRCLARCPFRVLAFLPCFC